MNNVYLPAIDDPPKMTHSKYINDSIVFQAGETELMVWPTKIRSKIR